MKESDLTTEPIAQNLIKLISNVCFSVFVFTVLIFTVIAVTYQPPDPWLESAPALTKLLTANENATFKIDGSMLNTGEDIASSPISPPANSTGPVTEATIELSEEKIGNMTVNSSSVDCDDLKVVNCSDPRVLVAVQRFNLRVFKSIVFLEYETPVNVVEVKAKDACCDARI
ncbi:hypothetical protein F2Q69_00002702 [Brassica cretica]|uniref:DUF7074 domain-containing protein n=1 Tax=Brassica cretica TaxID=69181 RepID=A0A8S9PAY2_BRACR|nr:hypothetical protein F2Q69_00002702 [Brassica cretica]